MIRVNEFVDRARSFVAANYPQADAAFLGGSAATGHATASSDLDILILLPDEWLSVAFVETTSQKGQLVEAFVYGRGGLTFWLEKGREEARPVLDRLIAQGVSLIEGSIAAEVIAASREALDAGPTPIESEQLNVRRYSLSAMVDDVTDAKDPGLRDVAMSTAWKEAAELALLSRRGWIGSGTWLLRELRAQGDPFNLAAWVDRGDRDAEALVGGCRAVLDSTGGYFQVGYLRGEKPGDL